MSYRALTLAALAAFAVDQGSKLLVVHGLDLKTRLALDVLPPVLNFRMGWNRGINFGLLAQDSGTSRWMLIALALVVCGAVLFWTRSEKDVKVHLSAGILVGGALANVLDRLVYGAVADFLNMSCCGISNPFTFNLADVFVFAGALGLVLWAGKHKQ